MKIFFSIQLLSPGVLDYFLLPFQRNDKKLLLTFSPKVDLLFAAVHLLLSWMFRLFITPFSLNVIFSLFSPEAGKTRLCLSATLTAALGLGAGKLNT